MHHWTSKKPSLKAAHCNPATLCPLLFHICCASDILLAADRFAIPALRYTPDMQQFVSHNMQESPAQHESSKGKASLILFIQSVLNFHAKSDDAPNDLMLHICCISLSQCTFLQLPKADTSFIGGHCRQGDKVTREQNARIAALKEDNYEEYLKLAANTKNQRLRTLLEKTGSIISELGLKVGHLIAPVYSAYTISLHAQKGTEIGAC